MGFLFNLLLLIFLLAGESSEAARIFTIANNCKTTIWPGVTSGNDFDGGGFALHPGQTVVFTAPVGWSGRIWGRTGCNFDSSGTGQCQTGACGTALKCSASGATPASLAEFTLASPDFFDVSLVDGFNLPILVTPVNGKGANCTACGCMGDLRDNCPSELSVKMDGSTVACRSACDVFNTDEYCCRGEFGGPETCRPTSYSEMFKKVCPTAYSYAYDDPTSTFTCTDADYVVTFCASSVLSPPSATASKKQARTCAYHIDRLICSSSNRIASAGGKVLLVMLFLWWLSSLLRFML